MGITRGCGARWSTNTARTAKLLIVMCSLAALTTVADGAIHRSARPSSFSIKVRGGGPIAAGAMTRYTLLIDRHGPRRRRPRGQQRRQPRAFSGAVTLSVGGLPRGAAASFRPRRTRGSISALTLTTRSDTPVGTYRLVVTGRSGRRHATVSLTLAVSRSTNPSPGPGGARPTDPPATSPPPGPTISPPTISPPTSPLRLAASASGFLAPGIQLPLNMAVTNPNSGDLAVASLAVSVSAVNAPRADAAHPCTVSDFAATQFSGAYGFVVPASSTVSLASLGVRQDQWPSVRMLVRPVNQDGCKGASLTLSYSATGTG